MFLVIARNLIIDQFQSIARYIDRFFTGATFSAFEISPRIKVVARVSRRGRLTSFYIHRAEGRPGASLFHDTLYRIDFTPLGIEWEALTEYAGNVWRGKLPLGYSENDDRSGIIYRLEAETFYLSKDEINRVAEVLNAIEARKSV